MFIFFKQTFHNKKLNFFPFLLFSRPHKFKNINSYKFYIYLILCCINWASSDNILKVICFKNEFTST